MEAFDEINQPDFSLCEKRLVLRRLEKPSCILIFKERELVKGKIGRKKHKINARVKTLAK